MADLIISTLYDKMKTVNFNVYGILDVIHCYVYTMTVVDTVGMVVFFIVLVWFAVYTSKIKREYF